MMTLRGAPPRSIHSFASTVSAPRVGGGRDPRGPSAAVPQPVEPTDFTLADELIDRVLPPRRAFLRIKHVDWRVAACTRTAIRGRPGPKVVRSPRPPSGCTTPRGSPAAGRASNDGPSRTTRSAGDFAPRGVGRPALPDERRLRRGAPRTRATGRAQQKPRGRSAKKADPFGRRVGAVLIARSRCATLPSRPRGGSGRLMCGRDGREVGGFRL